MHDRIMTGRRAMLAAAALTPLAAAAQEFAGRPIRLVIPFVAGGATDVIGRVIAERLGRKLSTNVVVENRAGANGNIGAEAVARAEPDGHTLLLATAGVFSVNPGLYPNLPFSTITDLAAVSKIYDTGNLLVVRNNLPANTLSELVELAKAEPGRLTFASGGSGSSSHMFGELFQQTAGLRLSHVPYRSNGPALNDIVAGNVDMLFDQVPSGSVQALAGRVRPIAVTTPERVSLLPTVMTFAELDMPAMTGTFWVGLAAPRRTPAAAIAALNRAVVEVLAEPAVIQRLKGLGADSTPSTPEAFGQLVAADAERWARVVRAGNIRPD
ncbi:MAG: transporter substrate-binding protein [Rubritepida sp.]|nr:transporter substrate-binding protein [Rubritepida sp.]